MGTSTRNKGQSGHTPLVPSWLDEGTNGEVTPEYTGMKPIPPDGDINRFTGSRKAFTQYVSGGGRDGSSMRRTVSRYVNHALGGSTRATTRLGSARSSTARLYGVLNNLSGAGGVREVAHQLSINNLEGLPASEFFIKIATFVCPDGGTNDEGLVRSAYYDSITDNVDLYGKKTEELTADECSAILENFMGKVILEHIMNDIANQIITLPDDIEQVSHIEGLVEQHIKQSVSDACAEVKQNQMQMTNGRAQEITDSIYQKTYEILERKGE